VFDSNLLVIRCCGLAFLSMCVLVRLKCTKFNFVYALHPTQTLIRPDLLVVVGFMGAVVFSGMAEKSDAINLDISQ